MAENFPNLVREMDTQIYESERQRILNPREKQLVTYEETPIIITSGFLNRFEGQLKVKWYIQNLNRFEGQLKVEWKRNIVNQGH